MNLLDARVINTVYGLEIYSDTVKNIEIKEIYTPTIENPFYEVQFAIAYFLLRKERHYSSQRNYFCIRMNHDFSVITLRETETESLFAVKSKDEREATKKLLGEWLVKTNSYKGSINKYMKKIEKVSIDTEKDMQLKFLGKLLELTSEDIELASVERPVQPQLVSAF